MAIKTVLLLCFLLSLCCAQQEDKAGCRNAVYHVQTLQQNACCNRTTDSAAMEDLKSQLATLQNELKTLKNQVHTHHVPVADSDKQYYNFMDEIAMASCVAIMPGTGDAYAVRRHCGNPSAPCTSACSNAKPGMTCFNALHVYPTPPRLKLKYQSDWEKIGLKVYRYNSCTGANYCGPNYCCCKSP